MNIVLKDPKKIKNVVVTTEYFDLDEFMAVVRYGAKVEFGEDMIAAVKEGRRRIDKYLEEGRIYYGVTTGFGENVRFTVDPKDARQLQKNIVRSHSVSVGIPLDKERVRALMMTELLVHKKSWTGIALETLELIREFLNRDLYPFVAGEGSMGGLGLEGHLAMCLIGEGEFWVDGKRVPAAQVLKQEGLEPRVLEAKEGLSLLNGCVSAVATSVPPLYDCYLAMKNADIASALSFEALRGTVKTLDERIYLHKEHRADRAAASNMRRIVEGSPILEASKDAKVQDAYVLRAAARVHGAGKQLVMESYKAIMDELNSCIDNPQIYDNGTPDGECLMSANFDATNCGIHVDILCMAATIVATNCERTTARIIDFHKNDGLPSFLVSKPGLNSGFMIPQYTQAGLLVDMKCLCVPTTTDSIPVSAGQEDPNPMAFSAPVKACDCMRKLNYIIAIEIDTMLQAIDFVKQNMGLDQSPVLKAVYDRIRRDVKFMDEDRFLYPDLEYIYDLVREGTLVDLVEGMVGTLNFEE